MKTIGTKFYELNHHLGNVSATVSELRTGGNGLVQTAAAYYPFGMQMPGKNFAIFRNKLLYL
ncbi:MAG TPA: hypothetical protein DCQ31_15355 [Bacteroidales bacterium]|nr:hypothetical protein [Bacteroidales bacterium]